MSQDPDPPPESAAPSPPALLPWDIHPALTEDRLRVCAQLLAHARRDALRMASIEMGDDTCSIDRHGRISTAGLTPQSVALVVKQYADAAGLDPDEFAGHSLRRGFLTSAAESGADVLRMMEVSRHKRVETVREYVRRANLFRGHAGAGFL